MLTVLRVEEPKTRKGPYAFQKDFRDEIFSLGAMNDLEFVSYQLNNIHTRRDFHRPWQFSKWVDSEGVELGERPWEQFADPVAGFANRIDHDAWFGEEEYEIMECYFELNEFEVPGNKIIYSSGQLIFDRSFAVYQGTLIAAL